MNRRKCGNQRATASACVLVVVAAVAGCTWDSPERKANLDAAINEFDAASVGEIWCQADVGKPGPSSGYATSIYFRGADSWVAVLDRLEDVGYELPEDARLDSQLSFYGYEGISGSARLVEPNELVDGLDRELEVNGCDPRPAEGLVLLGFNERLN